MTPWSVPDCFELTAEYERLHRRYAITVDRLFAVGYQVAADEYRKLQNEVEEARVQREIAGAILEKHRLSVHPGVAAGQLRPF